MKYTIRRYKKTRRVFKWLFIACIIGVLGFIALVLTVWYMENSDEYQRTGVAQTSEVKRKEIQPSDINQTTLLNETNKQRITNGANPLVLEPKLDASALAKCSDMVASNYWEHNRPNGEKPWVFINAQGITYKKAGENLAYGFTAAEEVITGWMNSPSHKANLLDPSFTKVGFGVCEGENYVNFGNQIIVVQHFILP